MIAGRVLGYLSKFVTVRLRRAMFTIEKCPQCGAKLETGFGLMGGGYGPYRFCSSNWCRFMVKRQSEEWE